MAEGTKKCLSCGAIVSAELDQCPICGGRIFETGDKEKQAEATREYHPSADHGRAADDKEDTEHLSWSPDDEEDTLEMIDFTDQVKKEEETPKRTQKKKIYISASPEPEHKKSKRTLRAVRWFRRKKKAWQKQKAMQEKDSNRSETPEWKRRFDEQPPLTKRLIMICAAAAVVVIVVLICAFAIGGSSRKNNTAVKQTAQPTAVPTSAAATARSDGEPIGTIEVPQDTLINIRVSPDTTADVIGLTEDSEYPVYSIQQDGEYTWYQIDSEGWVADGGDWVTYVPAQ